MSNLETRLLDENEETQWEDKPLPMTPVSASKKGSTPASYVDPSELTPPPLASRNRGYAPNTPADVSLKPSDTPFGRRLNKFNVQFTFNEHLQLESSESNVSSADGDDDVVKRLKPVRRCEIDVVRNETGSRYMFDHTENRVSNCSYILDRILRVLVCSVILGA